MRAIVIASTFAFAIAALTTPALAGGAPAIPAAEKEFFDRQDALAMCAAIYKVGGPWAAKNVPDATDLADEYENSYNDTVELLRKRAKAGAELGHRDTVNHAERMLRAAHTLYVDVLRTQKKDANMATFVEGAEDCDSFRAEVKLEKVR